MGHFEIKIKKFLTVFGEYLLCHDESLRSEYRRTISYIVELQYISIHRSLTRSLNWGQNQMSVVIDDLFPFPTTTPPAISVLLHDHAVS